MFFAEIQNAFHDFLGPASQDDENEETRLRAALSEHWENQTGKVVIQLIPGKGYRPSYCQLI